MGKKRKLKAGFEECRVLMASYWLSVAISHWRVSNQKCNPEDNQLERFRWEMGTVEVFPWARRRSSFLLLCCALVSVVVQESFPSGLPDSMLNEIAFAYF